jgi:hypothetical protein
MSVEENKATVRHFLRELAGGNLDVIDQLNREFSHASYFFAAE